MKIVALFDNQEQQIGFRVSGIETKLIINKESVIENLKKVNQENNVAILVINKAVTPSRL